MLSQSKMIYCLQILLVLFQSKIGPKKLVCSGISTPSKTLPLFFVKPPLKPANCPSPHFLATRPYFLFVSPSPKNWIFELTHKILKFSSLTSSHLLKVTKFNVEISHFKLLVMTEKKNCVNKLFLTLNILDFSLFFM